METCYGVTWLYGADLHEAVEIISVPEKWQSISDCEAYIKMNANFMQNPQHLRSREEDTTPSDFNVDFATSTLQRLKYLLAAIM